MTTRRAKASVVYDVIVKVAVPVLLLVCTAAGTRLMDQERRIAELGTRVTILETRNETILSDVAEIKADVKKLLGR